MYDETDTAGKRKYTVAQIAAEFGVSRPTIYRHLARPPTSCLHYAPRNGSGEPAVPCFGFSYRGLGLN
jgi:transposase